MSGVQEALAAGEAAAPKRCRYRPVGLRLGGWLIAQIEDTKSEEVEEVFLKQGDLLFFQLGRNPGGDVKVFSVRDKGMKKIAKAMLDEKAPFRRAAMTELHEQNMERVRARQEAPAAEGRARRKR